LGAMDYHGRSAATVSRCRCDPRDPATGGPWL